MTNAKRKTTRRDLPFLCLIYSVPFAFAALALPFGASLDMAKKSELHSLSGTVQSISRTDLPKAGPKLHIFVTERNRLHHLTQDDLFYDVPELRTLRAGDNVTALVRRDFFGRNLEWVWEVQRDGVTILSYDQTQESLERRKAQVQVVAHWAGLLSIGLFVVAILLRMHFDTWQDSARRNQPTTQVAN
jgi:hypothetical protein